MDEYRREPWGTWRDNVHAGMVASTIANAFRGEKSRTYSVDDFMILDPEVAAAKREADQAKKAHMLIEYLKAVALPKRAN
jgi:aspartyl/asparaginyl-tRNA synthetase